MNDIVELSIVVLAGVVHATLQLGPGCLLLLYHASLGKHIKARTRQLVNSYIAGVGTLIMFMVPALCFEMAVVFNGSLPTPVLLILISFLVGMAMVVWMCYYRKGRSTELWLPKVVSRYINSRAEVTDSNTEAFSLGLLTSFAEMPFTLVLTIIAANSILELSHVSQFLAILIYVALALSPLIAMRVMIKSGKTVADVQKWRVKNKNFMRIISGIGFLTLAIFLMAFKAIAG